MKRTPLKRITSLRRKRAISRHPSARAKAYAADLDKVTPPLRERSGDRCEAFDTDPDGMAYRCGSRASDRHHVLPRSHGGTNDLDNLRHLCRFHHLLIHENPQWAYSVGLLKRSGEAA